MRLRYGCRLMLLPVVPMNQRFSLYVGLLFGLLSLAAGPAGAQQTAADPILLWGVQRGCQSDVAITSAVQDRLQQLGTPVYAVAEAGAAADHCLGEECADLLVAACPPGLLQRSILLGGHVEDRHKDGRYQARVRLWRVDLTPQGPRSFYRHERLDKPCPTGECNGELPALVTTWMGQLLEDTRPSEQSAATLHSAKPPYCTREPATPAFLCAPFNLLSRCGEIEKEVPSTAASPALRCPMAVTSVAVPSCDCSRPASCEPAAQAACPQTPAPLRSPTLRRALGGSLLAAGGILIGASVLMTLNNYTSLTLRQDESTCGFTLKDEPFKCFVEREPLAASWTIGVGLAAGGALILLDPLRLFRDRPAKSK